MVASLDPQPDLHPRLAGANVATAVVRAGIGGSEVHRARGAGPLRLLTPRSAGGAAWLVTSSLGGGLVDGDDVALDVTVEPGAACLVTTQSSTKVYRGTSSQRLAVRVGDGATAVVVPDPVVPYRGARFTQRTTIDLAGEGSLVLIDAVTAGRVAYGERWAAERLDTGLAITERTRPRLLDRIVLDPAHGEVAVRMGRFDALATVVMAGPRIRDVAASQLARVAHDPVARRTAVVVAGSPFLDGAVFRIAGDSVERVVAATRALVLAACHRVGEDPWARKW